MFGDTNFAGFGALLVTFSYSRDFESQADANAIDLLQAAGLETGGLARFFARLEADEKNHSLPVYLSNHPPTAERRQLVDRSNGGGPALTTGEWQQLREICRS